MISSSSLFIHWSSTPFWPMQIKQWPQIYEELREEQEQEENNEMLQRYRWCSRIVSTSGKKNWDPFIMWVGRLFPIPSYLTADIWSKLSGKKSFHNRSNSRAKQEEPKKSAKKKSISLWFKQSITTNKQNPSETIVILDQDDDDDDDAYSKCFFGCSSSSRQRVTLLALFCIHLQQEQQHLQLQNPSPLTNLHKTSSAQRAWSCWWSFSCWRSSSSWSSSSLWSLSLYEKKSRELEEDDDDDNDDVVVPSSSCFFFFFFFYLWVV